MLLAHARTLAKDQVYRTSAPEEKMPKTGPFTKEHFGFDDWEPFYPPYVQPMPPEDCGCEPESTKKTK